MVPDEKREHLVEHARAVVENARVELSVKSDIARVEQAASWVDRLRNLDDSPQPLEGVLR